MDPTVSTIKVDIDIREIGLIANKLVIFGNDIITRKPCVGLYKFSFSEKSSKIKEIVNIRKYLYPQTKIILSKFIPNTNKFLHIIYDTITSTTMMYMCNIYCFEDLDNFDTLCVKFEGVCPIAVEIINDKNRAKFWILIQDKQNKCSIIKYDKISSELCQINPDILYNLNLNHPCHIHNTNIFPLFSTTLFTGKCAFNRFNFDTLDNIISCDTCVFSVEIECSNLQIWKVESTFNENDIHIYGLAFNSKNNSYIIKWIYNRNETNKKTFYQYNVRHVNDCRATCFKYFEYNNGDNIYRFIVVGILNGVISIWDADTFKCITAYPAHSPNPVTCLSMFIDKENIGIISSSLNGELCFKQL